MAIVIPSIPKVEFPKFEVKKLDMSHLNGAIEKTEKVTYLANLTNLKNKTISGKQLDEAGKAEASKLKNQALANGWMTDEDASWYLTHI